MHCDVFQFPEVSSLLLKQKLPEEIIKVTIQEPKKTQAKQWDSEDEFDHILPLHQVLARYHTDTKTVCIVDVFIPE